MQMFLNIEIQQRVRGIMNVSELADIATLFIACLALFVSIAALRAQRKHNRLSVRPMTQAIIYHDSERFEMFIANAGLGPMRILSIEVAPMKNRAKSNNARGVLLLLRSRIRYSFGKTDGCDSIALCLPERYRDIIEYPKLPKMLTLSPSQKYQLLLIPGDFYNNESLKEMQQCLSQYKLIVKYQDIYKTSV
jgi:hypothetical protein